MLSIVKPTQKLSLQRKIANNNSKIKIKQIIKIYIDSDERKKLVESATTYALSLTNAKFILLSIKIDILKSMTV